MSEQQKPEEKKLSLAKPRSVGTKKGVETGQVRQSFSHGRSKTVTVEVRKRRSVARGASAEDEAAAPAKVVAPAVAQAAPPSPAPAAARETAAAAPELEAAGKPARGGIILRSLTTDEKAARARAVEGAREADVEARRQAELDASHRAAEDERLKVERDASTKRTTEEEARKHSEEGARLRAEQLAAKRLQAEGGEEEKPDDDRGRPRRTARVETRRPAMARRGPPRRRGGKLTVSQALSESERVRSLASVRRARERERRAVSTDPAEPRAKVVREVILPETITVQELANRMAERGVDVVKALMNMGVMSTINQTIDPDTAELVIDEFGHRAKRVSDADVEIGLKGEADDDTDLEVRPPVVTVMGHVDHGKTSLLDALRNSDVVSSEAGGITQHIGAYQVELASGAQITFVDTPGHKSFTAMRARGAKVTDIVVLVVAADDGIMPQTIEAIDHAKAAGVPIVVAINKIDKPDANPDRIRQQLLQHGLVVEEMGGEMLSVEVSATARTNLDKLEEMLVLQGEILDLKANPKRSAEGVVIESKLDRGRGAVATVLVQRGTLRVGDIAVAGGEWGRVRALLDEHGRRVEGATPSMPVELLGLNGVPEAGDEIVVVESESRARQVTEFRQQSARQMRTAAVVPGTLEQMFSRIELGEAKELPIVLKADVHGSLEAILGALDDLATDEVKMRILHAAVGGISESDIVLARASEALVIGFNVRADPPARELSRRDRVDIRYYSIIYELIDDMKSILSGMLPPAVREQFLGNAEILEVFSIGKLGKIAGCQVKAGVFRRGAKVRLLRDSIVVHEGTVSSLKRFKDDVREVRDGNECGISLENYHDVQVGDVIETFEVQETARTL